MIYLIGICHSHQVRAIKPVLENGLDNYHQRHIADDLETYLTKKVGSLNPELIAEEYAEVRFRQQKKIDPNAYLVAARVCEKTGIRHLYCEPDNEERASMGITGDDFDEREKEWLRRLNGQVSKSANVLFLCGGDHVDSFADKLVDDGFEVTKL